MHNRAHTAHTKEKKETTEKRKTQKKRKPQKKTKKKLPKPLAGQIAGIIIDPQIKIKGNCMEPTLQYAHTRDFGLPLHP